ncbi:MAG: cryptochrome/photolyase family protein [Cytophagales bacterium]|nr:MAG: cryptochrome/photolyase family protein [Cytophagales bacterium]
MKKAFLIFPHQLFEQNPMPLHEGEVWMIEEKLFFEQYTFHQQKIAFHRASMRYYAHFLTQKGIKINYIEAKHAYADIRVFLAHAHQTHLFEQLHYIDPTDNWLQKRIQKSAEKYHFDIQRYDSPLFLNHSAEVEDYLNNTTNFLQTSFYIAQRKKRKILLEPNQKPLGGKWTYDAENRLKYPKQTTPPLIQYPENTSFYQEAISYTKQHFSNNYGQLSQQPLYPHTHAAARLWLENFLEQRFYAFGKYEDAIVAEASILHHSVLTPMLNVGLLTPAEILRTTLDYAQNNEVPLNSLEGFIRQIIGWREFIRMIYEKYGSKQRSMNYWQHHRKIPRSFWTASTGILPLDQVLKKTIKTGYVHHIERLMVIGNFMLLCQFDPNEVYRWFMEMFIDAYDWVMVPNVYGMSQFADGGLMATKPYISGSNYLLKMSDFQKGQWQNVWDALFWHFMHNNRSFFLANPRLAMLIRQYDKMDINKKATIETEAKRFLERLET